MTRTLLGMVAIVGSVCLWALLVHAAGEYGCSRYAHRIGASHEYSIGRGCVLWLERL